jgi:hypothetical protein
MHQRSGKPVPVLADARPLPQRRAVVDEDAHVPRIVAYEKWDKSLGFNGLTGFFRLC